MAQGMNNAAIAKTLFLTDRAVEKHINSMFHKLGLTEEPDVHRRVMAVLAFLRGPLRYGERLVGQQRAVDGELAAAVHRRQHYR